MDERALNVAPNPNILWGILIIEELYRNGVQDVVVAPGSRSTPLVVALALHPELRRHLAIDERGGGYLALGLARGSRQPVAVITTSGTAVANLLPAMVEASADHVPLIALTADRPPELQDVGANQTIRQSGIFGEFTRWQFDLPCPDDRIPARVAVTTVDRAVARSLSPDPGPVHLNCAFREPLAPTPTDWDRTCLAGLDGWARQRGPFTDTPPPTLGGTSIVSAVQHMTRANSGLLVAGTIRDPADASAIVSLSEKLGWPLVTDIRSGLRLGLESDHHLPHLTFAVSPESGWRPDVVAQFGGHLVSKRLAGWLDEIMPPRRLMIDPAPATFDPDHRGTVHVVARATEVLDVVEKLATLGQDGLTPRHRSTDLEMLRERDRVVASVLDTALGPDAPLTEPLVARWLSANIAAEHALFISSSLPIRDMNTYATTSGAAVPVAANRGASGIDGTIASAVGFAAGLGRPVTLLVGDLALLHDVGSLALARDASPPVTIVLVDNGGGGIFEFLPIASHRSVFTPWFDTPQDTDLTRVIEGFDLPCADVSDPGTLAAAYEVAIAGGRSAVIRVASDRKTNVAFHRELDERIATALSGLRS